MIDQSWKKQGNECCGTRSPRAMGTKTREKSPQNIRPIAVMTARVEKEPGQRETKTRPKENLRNPVGFSTLLGVAHVVPSAHFCMKALAAPRGARGQGCSS